MYSSEFWSWASTRATPNISLVFKASFTVLADSAKLMVYMYYPSYFLIFEDYFKIWILGSTCTPLSSDLGQVKII